MILLNKHDVKIDKNPQGHWIMSANEPLAEVVPHNLTWLHHWAEKTPDAVFLAEREEDGWRVVSYAQALHDVRAIAGGLLKNHIGYGSRIMVISGNGVDHGLLALAAQYIGAAIIPLAEQYALIPQAHGRLLHAAELTKPDMVYAVDGEVYAEALKHFSHLFCVTSKGGDFLKLAELISLDAAVDEAHQKVNPDTIAKILMTSGSTSLPKAVLTTQKMLCTNQTQLAQAAPFLKEKPPVIMDWLPWNHVFGGSHNFHMMLANGGALYIDDGKPTEKLFSRTIENLHMQAGSIAFNVPVGFAMLHEALQKDAALAKKFFENLDMIFYAGASLPQEVWEGFENLALEHRGELPLMTSSWGLTETAPACIMQQEPIRRSGVIGVPLVGVDVKLIPLDERFEVRVRGDNVFEAYLDDPDKTKEAFDEDGYFITGDAMAFVNPDDPNQGLRFEGRVSEEFKLLTGTWVRAGALRLELLTLLQGLVSDLVITGADRTELGIMVFLSPNWEGKESLAFDELGKRLNARADEGQPSSAHIARALILHEPPSLSEGEITAKGNLNFRKILSMRADELERLYENGEGVYIYNPHRA